jgi:two-component system CheB/CheR fusion protein
MAYAGARHQEPNQENAQTEDPGKHLIVGIGASAGGVVPLEQLFQGIPTDSDISFVVVTHLPSDHHSHMPEILSRRSAMSVHRVEQEAPVEPNHIYVIPPNTVLTLQDGILRPSATGQGQPRQNVIDAFFESLAEVQGEYAVGIVLSGSGSDGTIGLRAIKEGGGMTMVQDPDTAQFSHMPRSAINAGAVDYVLPVEQMPDRLVQYIRHLHGLGQSLQRSPLDDSDKLRRICVIVRERTSHDFSYYKQSTMVRRIQRRLQVNSIDNLDTYIQRLREDGAEADLLFKELLIGVTQFFRDPEAFQALEQQVIPQIFAERDSNSPVRVWVAGCSTGEEAYSIAILMAEHERRTGQSVPVQIFATDIDQRTLESARLGCYPQGIVDKISNERLGRYFHQVGETYQVTQEIREMCVFSAHDLLRDPPFSRVDLVSCRNLLIYLQSEAQQRVMPLLHYALRPGGFLFLGHSENVAAHSELFEGVSGAPHIFHRRESISSVPLGLPALVERQLGIHGLQAGQRSGEDAQRQRRMGDTFRRMLLEEYAPAAVVINDRGEILEASGQTRAYLQLPQGAFENNLFSMVRVGLLPALRRAFHQALQERRTVVVERVPSWSEAEVEYTRLTVRPMESQGGVRLFMVVLQPDIPPAAEGTESQPDSNSQQSDTSVQELEYELQRVKEDLRANIEELETSNEELKSSNEELISMNEELYSANEELQASKEEVQSINEELHTVNAQLSRKVEELDRAKDDIENLLRSTGVATLFLNTSLRIKWFTPAAQKVFPILDSDVGRPITDISAPFQGEAWMEDIRLVIRDLVPRERDVHLAQDSEWFIIRVVPYRTRTNVIDGVVVTFVEVTELQRARLRTEELASIVASSNDAIVSYQLDGTITSWNGGAVALYGFTSEEMMGQSIWQLVPPEYVEEQQQAQSQVLAGESMLPSFDTVRLRQDGGLVQVSFSLSSLRDMEGNVNGFSAIMRDITKRKHLEEDRERLAQELQEESRQKDAFLAVLGHELRNPLAAITSAIELLGAQDPPDAQTYSDVMEILRRQVSQLNRLVNDLTETARISRGIVDLRLEPLDIAATVREVAEGYRPTCETLGLSLVLEISPEPIWVIGDRDRLAQVIGNLFSNSAKFTPAGGTITLSAARSGENTVTLVLRDTGRGADPDTLSRLLQAFEREEQVPRPSVGLGLGLTLSKGLIERHGGTIQPASAGVGQGFEVTIELPTINEVTQQTETVSEGAGEETLVSRRVLIIEDHPDLARLVGRVLEASGHQVQIATDGKTGLELAREFEPEAVICDLFLAGELDGHAVAQALNHDPGLRRPELLIAFTGFSGPAMKRQVQESGFDILMVKPPDFERLERLIANLSEE